MTRFSVEFCLKAYLPAGEIEAADIAEESVGGTNRFGHPVSF
jgi:hypothetical protein